MLISIFIRLHGWLRPVELVLWDVTSNTPRPLDEWMRVFISWTTCTSCGNKNRKNDILFEHIIVTNSDIFFYHNTVYNLLLEWNTANHSSNWGDTIWISLTARPPIFLIKRWDICLLVWEHKFSSTCIQKVFWLLKSGLLSYMYQQALKCFKYGRGGGGGGSDIQPPLDIKSATRFIRRTNLFWPRKT